MNEYPMKLIEFLHTQKVKIGEFEEMLDENWDAHLDPLNDSVRHALDLFFIDAFPDLSLDEIDNITSLPEMSTWYDEIYRAKRKDLQSPMKNIRRPKFLLPSKLLMDINMQHIKDDMIATPVEWKRVFTPPRIRKGQLELLQGLFQSEKKNKILKAPTGIGKTWVVLAYATGKPALIVEPDRGLQLQMKNKYGAVVLMGRANYMCRDHEVASDISPCRFKSKSETTCTEGCQWFDAHSRAVNALDAGKPVVTNSWNMWQFFKDVQVVVFDEFHKILNELTVRYEIPDDVGDDTGESYLIQTRSYLEIQKDALYEILQDNPEDTEKAREYNRLMNELQTLALFIDSYNGAYIYPDRDKRYIKLDKVAVMKHMAESYNFDKVFVSATPIHIQNFDLIVTNESVSKMVNAPIVYYPVAKLTATEIRTNPQYLEYAAQVINMLYRHYSERGITEKIIIHTGNTTTHMDIADHLEMSCLKHQKGSLKETMEAFENGKYDALLIASADAGYDFHGEKFGLQFILKVPYPTRNKEWVAIKNKFGEVYEQNTYAMETINQMVQASGRICRGTDDTGMTVILDSKFADLFNRNREKFPDDFADRLIDLTGDLKHAVSREKIDYYQKVEK